MKDKMEKLGSSLIQHGKVSDRVYLMKLDERDLPGILGSINRLAEKNNYTKIFAKVPAPAASLFLKDGYTREAAIPGYFNGSKGCVFLSKFLSEQRKIDPEEQEITKIINMSIRKGKERKALDLKDEIVIEKAGEEDILSMSEIFKKVFKTYPFPIYDPEYLKKTMRDHINYYVALKGGKIAAISSAEMDRASASAEMTDFATLPEFRGRGLASKLLAYMEKDIPVEGIKTVYTISRALSYGINIVFGKHGYHFGGTLTRNTNIAGAVESMNVWYKSLI